MGTLETLAHERLIAPELGALLEAERDGDDPQLVRAVRRDHDIARRVPSELATEMAVAGSEGFEVWLRAREANDFAVFEPALRRNIDLARRYADCFAEAEHPYDALLDRFEPDATAAQVSALFVRLRGGLVPLLAEIAQQPAPPPSRVRSRPRRSARSASRSSARWASTTAHGAWTMRCTRSRRRRRRPTSASRRASTRGACSACSR